MKRERLLSELQSTGLRVAAVVSGWGLLAGVVWLGWNLALPPLDVPVLSFPQALGFALFLLLFLALSLLLRETQPES